MLVAIFVGVRQQRLFPVCLFDVRVGARGADAIEGQDVVKSGGVAFSDAKNSGLLVHGVGAALIALVMFAVARGAARVGTGGCGFWHLKSLFCDAVMEASGRFEESGRMKRRKRCRYR